MIADWTVDIGTLSPSIDVPWDGWVNLFWGPGDHYWTAAPWREERAAALPEVQAYPELLHVLKYANSLHHRTSKLDVFTVEASEVDPEIAETCEASTRCGLGSYLDIITHRADVFPSFDQHEAFARKVAGVLSRMDMPNCCAEIVIRPAHLFGEPTYGWTVYSIGFGPDPETARAAWAKAFALITSMLGIEVCNCVEAFWAERRRQRAQAAQQSTPVGE